MVTVAEVAEAYSHVVVNRVGYGDGDAESHDAVCEAKGVEISVAEEEDAGEDAPDESDRSEDGIGEMCDGEDSGCDDDWGGFAG